MQISMCATTARCVIHSLTGSVPRPSNAHRQTRLMKTRCSVDNEKKKKVRVLHTETSSTLFFLLCHFMNSNASLVGSTILSYANASLKLDILKERRSDVRLGICLPSSAAEWNSLFNCSGEGSERSDEKRDENLLQTRSCSHGCSLSVPCPCPLSSHPHPLSPHNAAPFPLPIPPRPTVGVLTFPPLHLPPSPSSPPSPLLHSPPFPSLPIYFESHAGPVPQNLKPCASGLVGEAGGEGGREGGQRGHYQDVTV